MIDLAAIFDEMSADLEAQVSGFPVSGKHDPERQISDKYDFSGISGISGSGERSNQIQSLDTPQAGARERGGGRARADCGTAPEMPETPEKFARSTTCLSGSLSENPEKERETGKVAPLPALAGRSLPEPPTFAGRAAFLEYECGLSRDAAAAQARAECEPPDAALAPDLAALPQADGLPLWRAGLDLLGPHRAPCPGYRGDEWPRVYDRAHTFLDTYGAQAEALGWTAPRLFGVHPVAGIVRVDACGGLVLPIGGPVRAITDTEIRFGHLTHRKKPGQPEGILIWSFGQ